MSTPALTTPLTRPAERTRDLVLVAAVIAIALVARLIWLYYVHPDTGLVDDAGYYEVFARSIASGHGYVRSEGTPTAFWPVGYPAILAALYAVVGESLRAAKLLNLALGSATAGLVYLMARRWFAPSTASIAGLLYALTPGAIGFVSLTMSETLFTFVFIAALTVLAYASDPISPRERVRVRALPIEESPSLPITQHGMIPAIRLSVPHPLTIPLHALLFGALVAAAAYVRTQALFLPLIALPWLLFLGWPLRRAMRYAGIALAVVALLSLPWLVRNTDRFGELTLLSTSTGMNFWLGHRAGANGGPDYHAQLAFAQRFDYLPRVKQEPAWNRAGLRDGLDYVLDHPLGEPRLSALKVYQLYRSDHDALLWNEQNGATPYFSTTASDRLRVLFDTWYYALGLLALAGLAIGLRRREGWAIFSALVIAYWSLGHVVFYGEPRLHVPLLPILALLAAVPLSALVGRLRSSRSTDSPAF